MKEDTESFKVQVWRPSWPEKKQKITCSLLQTNKVFKKVLRQVKHTPAKNIKKKRKLAGLFRLQD